jgi:hypothetical protein
MIQTDPRPSLGRLARLGAAACCAAAIAACGAGGTSTDTANTADRARDGALKFAQCMRKNGIDMPDPKVDGNGGMAVTLEGGPKSGNAEADLDKAQKACGKFMEDIPRKPLDAATEAKLQDAMLAHARCMRKHGIDMPDPEFSSSGGRMTSRFQRRGGASQDGPESPRFKAADEACGPLLEGAGPAGSTPMSTATAVPGSGR